VGDLDGDWSSTPVSISIPGWSFRTYGLMFTKTVNNCMRFTLHYSIESSDYARNGYFYVFIHRLDNAGWVSAGKIYLSKEDMEKHTEISQVFEFDPPYKTFNGIAVIPEVSIGSWCDSFYVTDVQEYIG